MYNYFINNIHENYMNKGRNIALGSGKHEIISYTIYKKVRNKGRNYRLRQSLPFNPSFRDKKKTRNHDRGTVKFSTFNHLFFTK